MKKHYQKIGILLFVLFVLISTNFTVFAKNTAGKVLPEIVQTGDEKFDKTFREGRELIDRENWKEAAEKFKSIVCDCPEKKYVDAAFYWLAFTYKKQKMYAEMNTALDRLQKSFPNSSWADDARVMRMNTTNSLFDQRFMYATGLSKTADPNLEIANSNLEFANKIYGTTIAISPEKTPLEREEEVKLAAFRSLFSTDAERAIKLSDDLLRPDSKASENLKIQLIRLISSQRNLYNFAFASSAAQIAATSSSTNINTITINENPQATTITSGQNSASSEKVSPNKLTPQIREILVRNYKANSSVKIKKELILGLGRLNDDESTEYLSELYRSESDKQLKKSILQALGNSSFARGNDSRKLATNKLLEIVKNEQDIELKTAALNSLRGMVFWTRTEDQSELLQMYLQVYDSSDNENFKAFVINSMNNFKQDAAVNKLMDIAKNDKSDKLRIAAINALQGSKNPEVIKFLEDLIK